MYSYAASRLASVNDLSSSDRGFRANGGGAQAYAYDSNGNPEVNSGQVMTADASKGLAVLYNHLNLPRQATTAQGTIKWTYDATGRKLKKEVTGCPDCPTIEYADGIEHLSNGEVQVNHAEGRIAYYIPDPGVEEPAYWQSEYVLRDLLGNTRLTFADKNHDGYIQALDGDWDYSLSPPSTSVDTIEMNDFGTWKQTITRPKNEEETQNK